MARWTKTEHQRRRLRRFLKRNKGHWYSKGWLLERVNARTGWLQETVARRLREISSDKGANGTPNPHRDPHIETQRDHSDHVWYRYNAELAGDWLRRRFSEERDREMRQISY